MYNYICDSGRLRFFPFFFNGEGLTKVTAFYFLITCRSHAICLMWVDGTILLLFLLLFCLGLFYFTLGEWGWPVSSKPAWI